MSAYPRIFQKGVPRRIDKDRPRCVRPGTIVSLRVAGYISQELLPPTWTYSRSYAQRISYIEFAENTRRTVWEDFSAALIWIATALVRTFLGRSINSIRKRRVMPNGSRACVLGSVPRLPPKRPYEIIFSQASCRMHVLVDDPLRSQA